jgi:hypothetical protein
MARMTRSDLLARAIARRWVVKVSRTRLPAKALYGFPLKLADGLVLIQTLQDFDLAGYSVIRLRDVSAVRRDERDQFAQRVVRDRVGRAAIRQPTPAVPLHDWMGLFRGLGASERVIIVEREARDHAWFAIGRILAVSADSAGIRGFDARGHWDADPTIVPFDEVTRVQFDTPYSTAFGPYLAALAT